MKDYQRIYLWGVAVNGLVYQAIPVNAARSPMEAQAYLAALTEQRVGGQTNWRLPNIKELEMLLEYGRINPAVNTDYFTSVPIGKYWSKTPDTSGGFWTIDTSSGMTSTEPATARCFVWAVSGVEKMVHSWSVDDGTVTDNVTGLVWRRSHEKQGDPTLQDDFPSRVNWLTRDQALALCVNGWRLPEVWELRYIIDEGRYTPALDPTVFQKTPFQAHFLTATPAIDAWGNTNLFWRVSGDVGVALPGEGKGYALLVHGSGIVPTPAPLPTPAPTPAPSPQPAPEPLPVPAPTPSGTVTFTMLEMASMFAHLDAVRAMLSRT